MVSTILLIVAASVLGALGAFWDWGTQKLVCIVGFITALLVGNEVYMLINQQVSEKQYRASLILALMAGVSSLVILLWLRDQRSSRSTRKNGWG